MPDPIPAEEKSRWFRELTALQEELSASRLAGLVGSVHTALLERAEPGRSSRPGSPKTASCEFGEEAALVGRRAEIVVTEARSYVMFGDIRRLLD